jgi:hypothetical protein
MYEYAATGRFFWADEFKDIDEDKKALHKSYRKKLGERDVFKK